MTQGKMLGGSSSLNHLMYARTDPHDFDEWAKILNDSAWNYRNVLPYFKKLEKLLDEDLLASSCACLHGTEGPLKIARDTSTRNEKYLAAFEELGHSIVLDTTSSTSSLGYCEPLYIIGDGVRQSGSVAYLGDVDSRSNLCVAMFTTATKILIKDGVAIGVQVIDSSGNIKVLYTNKEVLVSAGAINSPKLLMLSGIGHQSHLESLGIHVVADLPVGNNLQDHISTLVVYRMEEDTSTTPVTNPYKFPAPTTFGFAALNPCQTYPDYQSINMLFPHDSQAQLQLCSNVFNYKDEICETFYNASIGMTTLVVIINLMMAESRGHVLLASADPADDPLIYTGAYSSSCDLKLMAHSLADFNKVLNTTYFRSVNATLVDTGLCKDTSTDDEFWECYALAMYSSLWHYVGTCAMGSVLDSSLRVKGVDALRVIDASSMPTEVSGNPYAAVLMIAERAADIILASWDLIP